MAATTKIEWTHHTWNPWRGCSKCAIGCKNCYAMRRGGARHFGNNPRIATAESGWKLPVRYNRAAQLAGERRRIFPSLCDPFERSRPTVDQYGNSGPSTGELRQRMFKLIEDTPWLDWLLLTKRPGNIYGMMPEQWQQGGAPNNVWYGTSVSTQEDLEVNVPALVGAGFNGEPLFVSYEPALGPIEFPYQWGNWSGKDCPGIDWIIVGGESGHNARPCNVEWIRSVIQQCRDAGVPCFVKQLGANACWRMSKDYPSCSDCDALLRPKHPKGADPSEWPEDLRVQELPER